LHSETGDIVKEFGWCDLHDEPINEDTYEWKGCWGCYHFGEGTGFPYASVQEVASELGVSCSTVRRLIKSGNSKAYYSSRVDTPVLCPRRENITLHVRALSMQRLHR